MHNAVIQSVDMLLIALEPNREQCQEWLDKSVGVVTALLPHIGYENSATGTGGRCHGIGEQKRLLLRLIVLRPYGV